MRLLFTPLILLFFIVRLGAQETLVRSFPADTFNVTCASCTLRVTDMALAQGQQSIPINLDKPLKKNLLYWRYFDDVIKEEVITETKPVWTTGTQLLSEMSEDTLLSLHINLEIRDSSEVHYRIFLLMAGISKKDFTELPLETIFDADTYYTYRFSAIFQAYDQDNKRIETFDCVDGSATLEFLDTDKLKARGKFNFTGSRVGYHQNRYFINGRF